MRSALSALTAVWAAAALLVGCAGGHQNNLGMEHIHALGVDPDDDTLYAASHHGLFRIRSGSPPLRVGDSSQDMMGFFILGPRHYLASGHPGPGESRPANLGLLESTDAGVTWQPVSLAGQVDFHAIDSKKGLLFGYDSQSQQIMVSPDLKTWERRARLPLADLAASPENPQFLLATTAQGLVHSADGGQSFALINSAPILQLVDWSIENAIVGVAPDGVVGMSNDHGATWTKLGTVEGAPTALALNGPREVYVATDRGIFISTDGGRNFTLLQALSHAPN